MQRRKDLIKNHVKLGKKLACQLLQPHHMQVRYYRHKLGIVVDTTRGRVRPRSSMQVSARKLAANFWKMNEMPLSEVMEEKKFLQRGENLSEVLSASVSQLSDHAPCGSVSQDVLTYSAQRGEEGRLHSILSLLKRVERFFPENDPDLSDKRVS